MSTRLRIAVAIAIAFVLGSAFVGYMLRNALEDDDDQNAVARPQTGTSLAAALANQSDAFPPFGPFTEAFVALDGECLRVVVADQSEERVQGLRAVTDLAPYDGMLFVFESDTTSAFTMADTLIPLDIGWYDADGNPVDRTTMQPCPETEANCPPYSARGPYRYALETGAGNGGSGAIGACPT